MFVSSLQDTLNHHFFNKRMDQNIFDSIIPPALQPTLLPLGAGFLGGLLSRTIDFFNYFRKGSFDWMINLDMTTDVFQDASGKLFLSVRLRAKNPSAFRVRLKKDKKHSYTLKVFRQKPNSSNDSQQALGSGDVWLKAYKLPDTKISVTRAKGTKDASASIDFSEDEKSSVTFDLLDKDEYTFLPNGELEETFLLEIQSGAIYCVSARIKWKPRDNSDEVGIDRLVYHSSPKTAPTVN